MKDKERSYKFYQLRDEDNRFRHFESYVMSKGVLCKLSKKSLVTEEPEDIQIQIQEDIIDE